MLGFSNVNQEIAGFCFVRCEIEVDQGMQKAEKFWSKLLFYGFLTRNASFEFDAGMRDRGLLNNPCCGLLTAAVVETLDI